MTAVRLIALLAGLAGPLAAQNDGGRGGDRLVGHVPPATLPALDSIVEDAARAGLPTEPLIQKALEGGAKGVAPDRLVAAVGASAAQLRSASALLRSAGETRPNDPAEVTAVAVALSRGVSPQQVARLGSALPGEPTGPALHAVADLVGHGFAEDSSGDLVIAGAQLGLRGLRFLDVAAAAVQELQRGRSHAAALAHVRAVLPHVPAPPRPAPATVSRARRVQPSQRP
jgi:hypothetical protein